LQPSRAAAIHAAGARDRRGADTEAPPWDAHDPDAIPRYNVTIRMNDHELEMLRYLAKAQEMSQQRVLNTHLMPLLKRLAVEAFEARRVKST
jgi:hypothetical protein